MPEKNKEKGTLEVLSRGPEQTLNLGRVFGEILREGDMVALIGELGAGKTVMVKGIAQGLGVENEQEVTSPSFVLVNEYEGRIPIYHIDLYRLQDLHEVENLGWEEILYGPGVALVEWAEKVLPLLPEERIEIRFQWVSSGERRIFFAGKGPSSKERIQSLEEKWIKEE